MLAAMLLPAASGSAFAQQQPLYHLVTLTSREFAVGSALGRHQNQYSSENEG
jgi:hypothetical protein